MKLLFASEDAVLGIVLGVLIVGFSGKYFSVPSWNILWGVLFAVGVIMTVLDVFHTLADLGRHPLVVILALLNNLIDAVFELAFMAKFFGFGIPVLSGFLNPVIAEPMYLFIIGIFFIVTSVIWLVVWPMVE